MKRYMGYAVLLFSLISLAVAIKGLIAVESTADSTVSDQKGSHIALILFRGSGFCPTCDIMEKHVGELFLGPLSAHQQEGRVVFKKINLEQKENEHYFFDYDLVTTSIVLSEIVDGKEARWKYLEDGWKLAETDPEAFKNYVMTEINMFQSGGGNRR